MQSIRSNMGIAILDQRLWFPQAQSANEEGLVAIAGDLSVPRLLLAYRSGLFPWTANPLTWWSPDPRGVFNLEQFHCPRRVEKQIRCGGFEITRDKAFRQVIEACAAPSPGRESTWISPEFVEAFTNLHKQGHAHSLEYWKQGELLGGVYGVAIGGFFAGESMFHRASNASKICLFFLIQHLRERGFALFDIQMLTPVTMALGGINIAREEYLKRLNEALELDRVF
jgi:leucyl/phenylalanyl-tRNA--protein transferase